MASVACVSSSVIVMTESNAADAEPPPKRARFEKALQCTSVFDRLTSFDRLGMVVEKKSGPVVARCFREGWRCCKNDT